jgi:uncharacterized membrane protein YoaK (UPF0700 family)
MTRVESSLLFLLAALAGWIDALSFTALGKVFTSFQSGNLIFVGLGVDEGDAQLLVGAGVSLLAFLAGTALGAYVVRRAEVDASAIRLLVPAFVLQLALLVALAVCWQVLDEPTGNSASRIALVALGAAAMGIQGAAVFALRIPGVVTNAMTATLMLAGIFLGLRARGQAEAQKASKAPLGLLAALCSAYALSALIVGAIDRPEVTSLGPAVLLTLAIAGLVARDREFLSIRSSGRRTLQSHPNLRGGDGSS